MIIYQLVEIRAADGAQMYQGHDPERNKTQTIWLTGPDRAKDVQVGDTGTMHYVSTRSRGYFMFRKAV
jgi:hypothetical protein